jgi:hypothetical protein
MTAAFLNQCGAWGRVYRDVQNSGFHLNVVDQCMLEPGIAGAGYLLDLAGMCLPGVPCPADGFELENAVARIHGALGSVGWTGGTAVVRSHLALPFIPSLNRQFPDAAFVFVHREPLDVCDSVRRTGWMPLRTYREFWHAYVTRFNAEMTRFCGLPDVRGYLVHPQRLIDGNSEEIRTICEGLGLVWTPAADALLANVRKEPRDG